VGGPVSVRPNGRHGSERPLQWERLGVDQGVPALGLMAYRFVTSIDTPQGLRKTSVPGWHPQGGRKWLG
jgi:hypothetical protein